MLLLPARAHAQQLPPPADHGETPLLARHAPAPTDLEFHGGQGWSSDRTLGNAYASTLAAGYRWHFLEIGTAWNFGMGLERPGTNYASGGLALSAVRQAASGVRVSLGAVAGVDAYSGVLGPGGDCQSGSSFLSFSCKGGGSAALPYGELRLHAGYVFPVYRRTHLALGGTIGVGRDFATSTVGYTTFGGSMGQTSVGSSRVMLLVTAGLTFDMSPATAVRAAAAGAGSEPGAT